MRRFVEISPETLKKVQVYCVFRDVTLKKFVTEAVERELEPYKAWFENLPAEALKEQKRGQ